MASIANLWMLLVSALIASVRAPMTRGLSDLICPKCRNGMRFVANKNGGRKIKCFYCDGVDPLNSPEQSLAEEMQPSKSTCVANAIKRNILQLS
jgi:hypothetical protein